MRTSPLAVAVNLHVYILNFGGWEYVETIGSTSRLIS